MPLEGDSVVTVEAVRRAFEDARVGFAVRLGAGGPGVVLAEVAGLTRRRCYGRARVLEGVLRHERHAASWTVAVGFGVPSLGRPGLLPRSTVWVEDPGLGGPA